MMNDKSGTAIVVDGFFGDVSITINNYGLDTRTLEALVDNTERIAVAMGVIETKLPRIASDVNWVKEELEKRGTEDPRLKTLAERLESVSGVLEQIDDAIADREEAPTDVPPIE